MDAALLTKAFKAKARDLGFDLVGIAPVEPTPEQELYEFWVARGYAGEMNYLTRNVEKRKDIRAILPSAKSVVVCGLVYNTDPPYSTHLQKDPARGWISRYAWGDDYHRVMEKKLRMLLEFVKAQSPHPVEARVYVDTGPVLDRVVGKYAGLGWIGKNTCLLNQELGSWFFIGEIITNLSLEYDEPVPDRCGTCNACIDACPTGAIVEPYVLDARRCISYLTIELRGEIPEEFREGVGHHVFGCDLCQDVCPWNRRAPINTDPAFQPRPGFFHPDLEWLLSLNENQFREVFRGSPVKRAKWRGLLRNVAIALGNSGRREFVPLLKRAMERITEPMVREHLEWAIKKLAGNDGHSEYEESHPGIEAESEALA